MIHFDLEGKKLKIEELNKLTEADDFWKDQKKSKKVINEINKNKRNYDALKGTHKILKFHTGD